MVARCLAGEAEADAPFSRDDVVARARALAAHSYENPEATVSAFVRSITREQWDKIVCKPDGVPWNDNGIPFHISFHHPGSIYTRTARFNVVEDGIASPVAFSADMFEYPTPELKEQASANQPGFAGFSLHHDLDGEKSELASFLGASYFQSRGRNSRFGIYARAVAVDTALPDGEEFPYFREFWLEKPSPEDTVFTLHALVDSPRLTGAVTLTITPGTSTIMDVDARWFLRQGAKAPGKIGFAPFTSMFLCAEGDGGRANDYRPEVHNSDGLLYNTSEGEWVWSPLVNPNRLVVNRFPLDNPRGFGLMQRDDDFDHYQDLDARFDRRPSLWAEPLGEWHSGRVELVEIPGSEDYHGNIVAYWVPDAPAAGEAGQDAPQWAQAYRLYWMTPGVSPHNLGRVAATRVVRPPRESVVRFIIDFEGEQLGAFDADTGLASVVETPEQFPVVEKRLLKNEVTSGWRLILHIRIPPRDGILGSLLAPRDGSGVVRFKALLKQGENLPDPLTETWVYDFLP